MKKILLSFLVGVWSSSSLLASGVVPDSTRKNETRIEAKASPVEVSYSEGMHQPFQEKVISIKKDVSARDLTHIPFFFNKHALY